MCDVEVQLSHQRLLEANQGAWLGLVWFLHFRQPIVILFTIHSLSMLVS